MKRSAYFGLLSHAVLWILPIGLLFLAGCASLSKDECLYADWRAIGYEDGARGYHAARIADHREACAKHGVTPNLDAYEMGRLEGLGEYCRPQNGYRLGARGTYYNGVCPEAYEAAFTAAYQEGKEVYGLSQQVNAKQRELNSLQSEYDGIEEAIGCHQDEIIADGVDPRRRLRLLSEIMRLKDEQQALADDIAETEYDLEHLRFDLAELKAQSPY